MQLQKHWESSTRFRKRNCVKLEQVGSTPYCTAASTRCAGIAAASLTTAAHRQRSAAATVMAKMPLLLMLHAAAAKLRL
jgi:hypothetical protein